MIKKIKNEGDLAQPSELSELQKMSQLPLDFKGENKNYSDNFGSYIVYVDESGDANLTKVDKDYPVFVLAFCIFFKQYYTNTLVPEVQSLKFNYFGHDLVVLHEKEIRRKEPPFTFSTKEKEDQFMNDLSGVIARSRFILISAAILKNQLESKPERNAYYIALSLCLENLYLFLMEKGQQNHKTFVIFEARGDKEDRELELEFRRICDGDNKFGMAMPFNIIIKSKQINSTGLQFADLLARPIGRKLIDPEEQPNRAFDILKQKFFCVNKTKLGEEYYGLGLSVYPPKSEKPR